MIGFDFYMEDCVSRGYRAGRAKARRALRRRILECWRLKLQLFVYSACGEVVGIMFYRQLHSWNKNSWTTYWNTGQYRPLRLLFFGTGAFFCRLEKRFQFMNIHLNTYLITLLRLPALVWFLSAKALRKPLIGFMKVEMMWSRGTLVLLLNIVHTGGGIGN